MELVLIIKRNGGNFGYKGKTMKRKKDITNVELRDGVYEPIDTERIHVGSWWTVGHGIPLRLHWYGMDGYMDQEDMEKRIAVKLGFEKALKALGITKEDLCK